MAIDKLVDSSQLDNNLTLVANAIRAKGGTSASLSFPTEYITAINAIPSGGSSGYTRTVIVPECTLTPTHTSDGNISGYLAELDDKITEPLEQWTEYIVTFNGVEYYTTAILMWGTNILLGEQAYYWDATGYPYPFGILYYNGECSLAVGSGDALTIKVEKLELTGSGGGGGSATLITKSITANGTYSAEDDDADGYSSVTVNVPSSAASNWTKVAETSYQVSTTNTSGTAVATWATGHSEIWTSSKWVYLRIRDTSGKREGYYYGGDQFFYNVVPINGTSSSYVTSAVCLYTRYSSSKFTVVASSSASSYGVFADRLYANGDLRIRARYSSSNTLTINGTYKVEVYLLDPPTGAPIFT